MPACQSLGSTKKEAAPCFNGFQPSVFGIQELICSSILTAKQFETLTRPADNRWLTTIAYFPTLA